MTNMDRSTNYQGMEMPATKTCRDCGEVKPLNEFVKRKGARDGLRNTCKTCQSAYQRAYKQANRERINEVGRAYREAHREQIAERQRAYREANRDKLLEMNREWRDANREHLRQKSKEWYEANRERGKNYARAWRESNYDLHRKNAQLWQQANPDKVRAYQHRRRARKACAVPQRWKIHDIVLFCCYWCGANLRAYGATSHVDHVMPIALGGPADASNEVMSCSTCNLAKSARHPLVWIAELVDG